MAIGFGRNLRGRDQIAVCEAYFSEKMFDPGARPLATKLAEPIIDDDERRDPLRSHPQGIDGADPHPSQKSMIPR